MASNSYDEKGRAWIFPNTYAKTSSHPVKTGHGEISGEMIKKLVDAYKGSSTTNRDGTKVVELEFACWEKVSKGEGKPYLFTTFDVRSERQPASVDNGDPRGSKPDPFEDDDFGI